MGPAVCLGPGAISMKEDLVQGAPLHSHTQISYEGTRDNSRQRAYIPATIVGCSRSSKPYAMVFGGVLLPRVKGLKQYFTQDAFRLLLSRQSIAQKFGLHFKSF